MVEGYKYIKNLHNAFSGFVVSSLLLLCVAVVECRPQSSHDWTYLVGSK
jgi:hypothetical protein